MATHTYSELSIENETTIHLVKWSNNLTNLLFSKNAYIDSCADSFSWGNWYIYHFSCTNISVPLKWVDWAEVHCIYQCICIAHPSLDVYLLIEM